jgi:hypothetical protein
VFLLSPASTSGKRAALLLSSRAGFDLALRVRSPEGASIGEVFSFLSGLYFRGKLTYARRFAASVSGIRVITSDRGLVSPDLRVTLDDIRTMAAGSIDPSHSAYRAPLERDVTGLARGLEAGEDVVLLGSIATSKYSDILQALLGARLKFPEPFVGLGDMSRGGMLLRAVREERELAYVPLEGTVRRGGRFRASRS